MGDQEIRFDDGEAYERFMGTWSRLVGEVFLDWIGPEPGLVWADVGCGNGAFTELLFTRTAAAEIVGVDPSDAQLAFAGTRLSGRPLTLRPGSAMELPLADGSVDASVMALVIFFVPEPERGVAEMVRATRPGGLVCAYAWDVMGGGFPTEPIGDALRAVGLEPPRPPRADASTLEALQDLWAGAGLEGIATHTIEVEREFRDADEWWTSIRGAPSLGARIDRLPGTDARRLRDLALERLPVSQDGRIRARARANAVRGTVPKM